MIHEQKVMREKINSAENHVSDALNSNLVHEN